MRSTVAVGAFVLLLGCSLPAIAQGPIGSGVYGQQGNGQPGFGQQQGYLANLPSRIANNLTRYNVQQYLPPRYVPPTQTRRGLFGRRGTATGGYYTQPYYWYDYKYFPVANSSLYAPSSLYPYGYTYNPESNYIDYYTPPYEIPRDPAAGMGFGAPGVGAPGGEAAEAAEKFEVRRPRTSNPESRRIARRFVETGDSYFQRQRYSEALAQYKSAAKLAPDLAEIYFRQGHAYVATRRYDLAAGVFRRGLALDPEIVRADYTLDTLYDDAKIAKHSHLDTLAATTLGRVDNADLLLVLGVFLHFDGQADRARKFFERSAEVSPPEDNTVEPFLKLETGVASEKPAGTRI
ncbi:MAG: tetratricopeptide repeat protein [Pirellulaceae bacterium]